MQRLFVAVTLPHAVRDRLAGLMCGAPGAKWTLRENLHLTLRFVGAVDEGAAADIDAALTQVDCPPFDLTLDGVGLFGTLRRPRTLWAGVAPSVGLTQLQARVEAAAQRVGQAAEGRKFAPHVTLARFDGAAGDRLGRYLEGNNLFRAGPFMVNGFSLMRSHLGRDGAFYEELRRYGANDAAPDAEDWTNQPESG